MNDLAFVERAVSLLASKGIDTWVFGGWGEELRGLILPREHADVDLLYPWKRAFTLQGVAVELFLVRRDERGWYTQLQRRRHDWPENVLGTNGRLPIASTAALASYRHSYRVDAAA